MAIKISKRAQHMGQSASLAMSSEAKKMRDEGIDVISFATGEPDFATPQNISNSSIIAIEKGLTKYPPSAGLPELRNAIAVKLKRENSLFYDPSQIAVTCGGKHAIYNALQVILDPGDEVVIPAPFWVSYPDQVKLADGKPVIVETGPETSYKITLPMLKQAITDKTRAFILNSPSNPTGNAYAESELREIGNFLADRGIVIISDEIYEKLVYDNFTHTSIAAAAPACKDLTILVNGVAKAYAMTGWRMGYAAGPKEIIAKMITMTGQQITGIPPFVQMACVEALEGPQDEIGRMKEEFKKRRDYMLSRMIEIPRLHCEKPQGAFYLFPDISAYLGKSNGIKTSDDLAMHLLKNAHIATVSGASFGAPMNIRFSYATSMKNIEEGMNRFSKALAGL
ncbi:MAG TPA: pyridoxal phosphate-dependent aminotransferase [bacterium]|nr:pyridoxal phosphate-dependent aminotransferase [bacterium]